MPASFTIPLINVLYGIKLKITITPTKIPIAMASDISPLPSDFILLAASPLINKEATAERITKPATMPTKVIAPRFNLSGSKVESNQTEAANIAIAIANCNIDFDKG